MLFNSLVATCWVVVNSPSHSLSTIGQQQQAAAVMRAVMVMMMVVVVQALKLSPLSLSPLSSFFSQALLSFLSVPFPQITANLRPSMKKDRERGPCDTVAHLSHPFISLMGGNGERERECCRGQEKKKDMTVMAWTGLCVILQGRYPLFSQLDACSICCTRISGDCGWLLPSLSVGRCPVRAVRCCHFSRLLKRAFLFLDDHMADSKWNHHHRQFIQQFFR